VQPFSFLFQPHKTPEKCFATLRAASALEALKASSDLYVEFIEAQRGDLFFSVGNPGTSTSLHKWLRLRSLIPAAWTEKNHRLKPVPPIPASSLRGAG
jgi:hypothetical protein